LGSTTGCEEQPERDEEGSDGTLLRARLLSPFVGQSLVSFIAKQSREDLLTRKQMIEAGTVRPIVERTYSLAEATEAVRHVEAHHARGTVVLSF
jgi:NADPH:quinone reductase-like Zn-dependent oxidoreductase